MLIISLDDMVHDKNAVVFTKYDGFNALIFRLRSSRAWKHLERKKRRAQSRFWVPKEEKSSEEDEFYELPPDMVDVADKMDHKFGLVKYLCGLDPNTRNGVSRLDNGSYGRETSSFYDSKKQKNLIRKAHKRMRVSVKDKLIKRDKRLWDKLHEGSTHHVSESWDQFFLQYWKVFGPPLAALDMRKFKIPLVGIELNPGPQRKGKRKNKSKKRNTSDVTTAVARNPSNLKNLLPDIKYTWMEFNLPTTVILTAAASNFAFLNLHPNDLWRPVVGTATTYTGMVALTTWYNYYLVEKWQLDFQMVNADAVPKQVFVIPSVQDLTAVVTTPATAQFYVGSRDCPEPRMLSAMGGMDKGRIKLSIMCSKFFGELTEYETAYNAVTSTSPANFINCGLAAVTTTANMTLGLMVNLRMRARVKFYSRKVVA